MRPVDGDKWATTVALHIPKLVKAYGSGSDSSVVIADAFGQPLFHHPGLRLFKLNQISTINIHHKPLASRH